MEELQESGDTIGLSSLPEELLTQIIWHLDNGPPSVSSGTQLPSVDELFLSSTPLKNLSSVSRQLRRILKPMLFRHLRICLNDVIECLEADFKPDEEPWRKNAAGSLRFLPRFAQRLELYGPVASLTTFQSEMSFDIHGGPSGKPSRLQLFAWSALVAQVKPIRLSIIAPPQTLALLLQRDLWMDDAWAFKISLQRIDLIGDPAYTMKPWDMPILEHDNSDDNGGQPCLETSSTSDLRYFRCLGDRRWSSFSYHGGSCLPSFGVYHYFLKVPPCLLTANDELDPLVELGRNLLHFSYATMFPHYHHFRRVLRNVAYTMPDLETLTLQLAPSPSSEVWQNLEVIGRGNLNLRDCWAEIERAYASVVDLLDGMYISHQPVFSKLASVTILDCRIKILEGELNTMIAEKTKRWVKRDEVTLERPGMA